MTCRSFINFVLITVFARSEQVCPFSQYSNGNVRWPRRVLLLVSHVVYALCLGTNRRRDGRTDGHLSVTLRFHITFERLAVRNDLEGDSRSSELPVFDRL